MVTPLCRLAQDLAGLTGWRRYGLAFALGALLAGALPPVDVTPLVLVAFPALLWLDEGSAGPWASARLGYVFALGFFAAGLYWIAAALFVDIAVLVGLPFRCWGAGAAGVLPGGGDGRHGCCCGPAAGSPRWPGSACSRCLWSAAEWARGHVLTGFRGTSSATSGRAGFRARWRCCRPPPGSAFYGLSLVTVLAASLPALLGTPAAAADAGGAAGRSGGCRGPDPGAGGNRRAAARPFSRPARPRPGCGWCSHRSPRR
jgi:apolipoprotein N-acyltransferase